MVTRAEIEGDMGSSHVGVQARLMSQGLRKLTGAIGKSNCVVIFINQLREKIGVVYGNPETTPGGRALKFYASVRLDIRRTETLKAGGENVGNRVRVKVVKNKVAPPFKEAEMDIMYGEGISKEGELLDIATKYDIILKSGSWFSYKDQRLGQGRDNVKEYIKKNPELFDEISELVRAELQKAASERGAKKTPGKAATAAGDAATPARAAKKSAGRGSAAANIDISADDLDK
jgi:recombination protein RecA